MQFRTFLALAMLASTASHAGAQSVLDEIEASIGGRATELERVEALLSNPDPKRRTAAMEAILKTGDPAFVRKAKEVGLFSADPQLRQIAVKAIFDAGGAFRLDIDAPSKDSTDTNALLNRFGGSRSPDGSGSAQFVLTGDYNVENRCWTDRRGNCSIRQTGDVIHLADWDYTSASFRLDDSGVLQGTVLYDRRGTAVGARIPLFE